jgi:hypothetical protein
MVISKFNPRRSMRRALSLRCGGPKDDALPIEESRLDDLLSELREAHWKWTKALRGMLLIEPAQEDHAPVERVWFFTCRWCGLGVKWREIATRAIAGEPRFSSDAHSSHPSLWFLVVQVRHRSLVG